ncbi:hypothetical protein PVIIG_05130 [Plasmodium vivax India VII]|uniref:Exonuclease 1 n=1 Tax=Plasmodium vivax India VII TaxID=1077284 RepID=A0A0J9V918_PLAVI|nr:hypothetical protein PVIIG_05130 [Plasmodium vivax India VII]
MYKFARTICRHRFAHTHIYPLEPTKQQMGITNLLPFLKPIAKSTHISKYKNEVIGVDIMCWIHRGLISCAYDIVTDTYNDSYLSFIEKMLECIYHYNIKVVFVFDGEELPEKKAENVIRKDRREKAKKEAQEIIKSVPNPRSDENVLKKCIQALSVSKEIINTVIQFCRTKNIDYIISPFEADAQLSYLCRMGYISCAISEDSDLLVYGCPRVLYKLKSTGECDEISLMPIDDLIDVNVINKIRNPLSDSFNEFYITPMKQGRRDAQGGHSDWEDNNLSDWEENNMTDLAEHPPARAQRRTRHRAAANGNPEQKKKSYHKVMKEYLDHFHWPEELDKLKHFSIDMFLAMCILSGCDYTNDFHITGMGIKTAFSLISQYKTIENIFSFLISHDRWKRKIPPNLNTLEKLMTKYEEIKNAFLHHQVYDFILCQNIPINQSFNSALKKNENKLLINKIRDFSLTYDSSKRRGNCLNAFSEELSSGASGGRSSFLSDGSGNSERCTGRSTRGEEKVYSERKHHQKDMLKGSASPAHKRRSPLPPKQTALKEHPQLDKPNSIENIFKNLPSECLEYLEISPDLFRNCPEGQNGLKEQEIVRHEGIAQEGSHGLSTWTSDWQSGRQNYAAFHPGELPPSATAQQEPPKGDMQACSPLHPRGTTQTANLWPPMECANFNLFGDSPRSNGCAHGRECTNDGDEAGVPRGPSDPRDAGDSRDTIDSSDYSDSSDLPAYNSRNNLPRGKEKTKLSKRKGNHADSVNFKKTKRSAAAPPHTGDQTSKNPLEENEPDCSKRSDKTHPGEILEKTKWISQAGRNCQGVARLEGGPAHGIDTSIQEDAKKGKPLDEEVTNPTEGTNRKKSARVMYQNMKKSFLLFKTLDGETSNQMGSSTEELKGNSAQEKEECSRVREIQGRCKAERPDEEGGSPVGTDIWDGKDKMRSGTQGGPIRKLSTEPISKPAIEPISKPAIEPISKPTIEPIRKLPTEPISKPATEPISIRTTRLTTKPISGVKSEINKTNFKSEWSDHPSVVCSPLKGKSSAVNGNRRSQLRITNFFKKSERKIPNLDGNKEGNNNSFPLRRPTNGSPSGNGTCSLSMNNSEPANEEQQGGELPHVGQDTHEKDSLNQDSHDEYVFLKNLHNCGMIKEPNRKEPPKWVAKGSQAWDDRVSRGDRGDHPSGLHSGHSMDHPHDHHDRPLPGDAPPADRPAEKKEKQKEINLEYILQNLNYNYHPRSHKINTFDYFKEKENVPPPNPYVDNNL